MAKRVQNIITASFFKTGLLTAFALISGFFSYGQHFKTGTPTDRQYSPKEVSLIFKSGFADDKKEKTSQQTEGSNARVAAAQSLPLNSQMFTPNAANTGWVLSENGRYTYDSQGNQTSLTRIPVGPYMALKDSSLYDAHGNQTFQGGFSRNPSGNIWNMDYAYRSQYTYDAAGHRLETINEDYNTGTWEKASREVVVYNAAGYATETTNYRWLNNSWVPNQKFIYGFTVATNPPNSMTVQMYNGSGWVNQFRFQNLTWHNFNYGEYLTREDQTWSTNAWTTVSRSTAVYDSFGGSVNVSQSYNGVTWENSERNTINKDSHAQITGLKHEAWRNNSWEFSDERQFLLTYNATNQLTEIITRNWDHMSSTMKNAGRITFSNFLVMGTRKEHPDLKIKAYPNPATDFLQLEFSGTGNVQAILTDLSGKVILNQNFIAGENRQLNLNNLNRGAYLLQVITKKGTSLQKIIKN